MFSLTRRPFYTRRKSPNTNSVENWAESLEVKFRYLLLTVGNELRVSVVGLNMNVEMQK
jgi:hypothetical protein